VYASSAIASGDDDDFFGNSFDPIELTYLYDYEEIELFGGLGFSLFDHPVLVFGTYVQNQAADDNDMAWSAGFKYGKTSKRHDWDIGYMYKHLEADAALKSGDPIDFNRLQLDLSFKYN
jgi:hypothetical protein